MHVGKDQSIAIWSTQALNAGGGSRARSHNIWEHTRACDGSDLKTRACVCDKAADDGSGEGAAATGGQLRDALVVSIEADMAVCSITWSSDESIVVAAGWQENTARAWYVPTGIPAQALAPLRRMICAVEWLVGHWLCAGGGGDEVIVLWSIEPSATAGAGGVAHNGKEDNVVGRLATGGRTVISLSCSSDGKQLVALLSGQVVRFYDLEHITQKLALQRQRQHHVQSYASQDWFGTGGPQTHTGMSVEVAAAQEGDTLCIHSRRRRECINCQSTRVSLKSQVQAVRGDGGLAFESKEQESGETGKRPFEYLESGPHAHVQVFECFLEISEPVAGVAYMTSVIMLAPFPRDRIMLSCVSVHGEPTVVEWDMRSNQVVQTFRGHRMQRFVTGMTAGGPGEVLVCAGSEDGRIMLWQRESGRAVKVLVGHQGSVNALSWCLRPGISSARGDSCDDDDDGDLNVLASMSYFLASASDDYTVRIWSPLSCSPSSSSSRQRQQEDSGPLDSSLSGLLVKLADCRPGASSPVAPNRKLGRRNVPGDDGQQEWGGPESLDDIGPADAGGGGRGGVHDLE